jgi:cytokinin dehydrogenase
LAYQAPAEVQWAWIGSTRYPIGALEFGRDDWARQYGPLWDEFRERKEEFDSDNILSPGSGIFR